MQQMKMEIFEAYFLMLRVTEKDGYRLRKFPSVARATRVGFIVFYTCINTELMPMHRMEKWFCLHSSFFFCFASGLSESVVCLFGCDHSEGHHFMNYLCFLSKCQHDSIYIEYLVYICGKNQIVTSIYANRIFSLLILWNQRIERVKNRLWIFHSLSSATEQFFAFGLMAFFRLQTVKLKIDVI